MAIKQNLKQDLKYIIIYLLSQISKGTDVSRNMIHKYSIYLHP